MTHFRAGYTKRQALPNNGQSVVEFPYVQINHSENINFLVVDVDRCDALMLLMHPAVPPATWIVHKPETGHAQAGWAIDSVYVGRGHHPGPKRYADSVLRSLNRLVHGDENFTRFLVQNPAARNPVGEVYWGRRTTPWHLGELKDHMESYVDPFHDELLDGPAVSAWQPDEERAKQPRNVRRAIANATGRNCSLFRKTLRWIWTRWKEGAEPHEPDALRYARELNRSLERPLSDKEVRELSASACRQARKGNGRLARHARAGEKNRFLSNKGRIGGKATTLAKIEAAAANAASGRSVRSAMTDAKALEAQAMLLAGESRKSIAEFLKATVRTVGRWLKRAAELSGGTAGGTSDSAGAALTPVASRMSCPDETLPPESDQAPASLPADPSSELEDPSEQPTAAVQAGDVVCGGSDLVTAAHDQSMSTDFDASRENARRPNGQFGTQPASEACLDLAPSLARSTAQEVVAHNAELIAAAAEVYRGAESLEFQYDPRDGRTFFLRTHDRDGEPAVLQEGVHPARAADAMDAALRGYPVDAASSVDPAGGWLRTSSDELGLRRAHLDITAAPLVEADALSPGQELDAVYAAHPRLAAERDRLRQCRDGLRDNDARGKLAFQVAVYSPKRPGESVAGRAVRQQIEVALDTEEVRRRRVEGDLEFSTEGPARLPTRAFYGHDDRVKAIALRGPSGERREDQRLVTGELNRSGGAGASLGYLEEQMRQLSDEQLAVSGITRTATGFTVRLDHRR